ncbi:hypothetical protein AHF37_10899 [Paragonimus kellicotti]|nr:hypothetical protein AHF37_10899 [Paragonimus kellicotti]
MLTAQEYIEPTAYTVHWKTTESNGPEIEQYKINVRPVEVDYSMGDITGRPTGEWVEHTIPHPNCTREGESSEDQRICQYRVGNLRADQAYELELSGENSAGFSEAQRIIFRTASLSGATGRMLNIPSYLRHTTGDSRRLATQQISNVLCATLISLYAQLRSCVLWQ